MSRVLVVEDDSDVGVTLCEVLIRAGFQVDLARDGRQGLREFHGGRPDLVILDVVLPELDGWQVLERIRDLGNVPVLMLTGYRRESDKVRGLTAGADDYLTKPFGNQELVARVHALLRRSTTTGKPQDIYDDGVLQIHFAARKVRVNGDDASLTPLEFRLLTALVNHVGQVLTPQQLLEYAWDDPFGVGPDRVKFSVLRLRRKLGWSGDSGAPIQNVRGFGYRYAAP